MSGSPIERAIKRLKRRAALDHNKAAVQEDMPGNSEATPVNSHATPCATASAATPALIVVPGSSDHLDLVIALVTAAAWLILGWRDRSGEPPVT
ncbi:hypothetical protein [Streptomyces sp. NPDC093094]|uniref:hypothetical protein n=1 Tax=Streptomyces sp. NPDC093094 TaxID=3366026 RepID=UPI00382865C2